MSIISPLPIPRPVVIPLCIHEIRLAGDLPFIFQMLPQDPTFDVVLTHPLHDFGHPLMSCSAEALDRPIHEIVYCQGGIEESGYHICTYFQGLVPETAMIIVPERRPKQAKIRLGWYWARYSILRSHEGEHHGHCTATNDASSARLNITGQRYSTTLSRSVHSTPICIFEDARSVWRKPKEFHRLTLGKVTSIQ